MKIKLFDNSFFKSDFLKNTSILVVGSAAAMVISFLFQIIIRRYYSPEIFGTFDLYLNIFNILVSFSVLKYDQAVVLPHKDKDSVGLVSLSVIISLLVNVVFFLVIVFLKNSVSNYLNIDPAFRWWFLLLPVSAFFLSSYQSINYWFIRNKAFIKSSTNKVYRRLAEGVGQSMGGIFQYKGGLVFGNLLGSAISFGIGVFDAQRMGFWRLFTLNRSHLRNLFKRYSNFPKYSLVSNVFSSICAVIPFTIISNQFDTYQTGLFGLSRMLVFTPITIIALSFGQVLFQKFTFMNREGKPLLREVVKVFGFLFLFAVLISLIIFPWSQEIVSFLFGDNWNQSGTLFSIMLIGFIFQFSVSPISVVLVVLEKLKHQTVWQIIYFLSLSSLFLFNHSSLESFVWKMVFVDSLCYLLYFVIIINAAKNNALRV